LLALRIVSAVTAAPAFFVHGVPTVAKASAGAIIGLTAAGVLLIGRPTTSPVVTR
jgi:peptide subunit release factor RF-3